MTLLQAGWQLARPFWRSDKRWRARVLLVAIICLNLGEVYINVRINQWNNDFYNALQALDKPAYLHALVRFSFLAAFFIVIAVYKTYLTQTLRIHWRRWLTLHYLTGWLDQNNYYRMQMTDKSDNPDQRIAEDIDQFVQLSLSLSLGMLSAVVTLFSFLFILWNLSGAITVPFAGHALTIPGYMVWVALAYAAIGTWIATHIGRPLSQLNFNHQRYEADFRFSLVRLRENSESIALYRGGARESEIFVGYFSRVVDNFWEIIRRQKRLNWFTSGYGQIAIIFPFVVTAPRFFAGNIKLGGLMQTTSAFSRVQHALSYIVESYPNIAIWKATTQRLTALKSSIEQANNVNEPADFTSDATAIRAIDLTIRKPDNDTLLSKIDLHIMPGDRLLITGASGIGKSTLLRTLAGIWPYYAGQLVSPEAARMLFVPQVPYMPLGTLREAVLYPSHDRDDAAIKEAMGHCQLTHLIPRLDAREAWSHVLSQGEQQRIAFVRILLAEPDFLFLDEATSALDEEAEALLYALILSRLPKAAIISVAHRPSLKMHHHKQMHL